MRKVFNHWATGLIVVTIVIGLIFGGTWALAQNVPALAFAGESDEDENEDGFFDDEDNEGEEHEDGESDDDDFEGGEGVGGIFKTVAIIGIAVLGIAVIGPKLSRSEVSKHGQE